MDITTIVILISILLIASVVGSIIFAKKEQAAALRRQQVASYRFKADEAQDMYDGLQKAGLEKIAYQFLLGRIIVNLQAAYKIDPRALGIKVRLSSAKSALASIDKSVFYIEIPSAMDELHALVGRLNKLVKYLVILLQKRLIDESQYKILVPAIQRSLLKFDAEGHIKMGHQAANEGQPGTAKQCYLYAKNTLLQYGSEDSYVNSQLEKVDELLATLGKDEQLNSDPTPETQEAGTDDNQPLHQPLKHVVVERSEDGIAAAASQKELNKTSDADSSPFAPKKKW